MGIVTVIIAIVVAAAGVSAAVYFTRKATVESKFKDADKRAQDVVANAQKEAQSLLAKAHVEAQDVISKSRISIEEEVKSRRQSVSQVENRVMQKEKYLDSREQTLAEKEDQIQKEQERVKQLRKKQEVAIQELSETLEKAAGFSKEEAQKILLANVERDARQQAGLLIKQIEDQAKKIANRKAKEIVTDAIQRTAVDHVVSATTSVLQLPEDDMKGRIIGREGRNIRAFESITGVDVIIDETPGAVVLSSFDPIRREIAKMSLEKLIHDGRIHPARIEEVVEKSRRELQDIIKERGERAAEELGLQFHPKIIELMGKLHYRTSYGQNILAHSLEAAHVAGIMAAELGVNVALAKRGTMLHDIGKAIDFEQEGSHTDLGKQICEKYGESPEIINCIMAHHEEEPPDTIEAVLVMVADAISSSRPGARRESMETYVKRLEKLEALAYSFEGVEKAYAIQAGREIRVIVKPDEVDDPAANKLAFDMARKVEAELDYPGEVKISVIRETRAVGVAR
ncbi:MAG: ribonuclease Y [Candidatus Margulisiibacteriota bacterium]